MSVLKIQVIVTIVSAKLIIFLTKTSSCHWRFTLVEVRNPTIAASDYKCGVNIVWYRVKYSMQLKYLKEFEESHCWSTVFILGVEIPNN